MAFSVTAAASSSRGTSSRTTACQAGPFSAAPVPIRKVNSSRSAGVSSAAAARPAASAEGRRRHPELGQQQHPAPVPQIGQGTGKQREQQDRRHGRGLDQRHHVGRAGQRGHQPGGTDALHQPADRAHQVGGPDRAEHRQPQRRQDTAAPPACRSPPLSSAPPRPAAAAGQAGGRPGLAIVRRVATSGARRSCGWPQRCS